MKTSELPDFREFLEREMKSRMRRNPGYSLRAFSRDIQMSPSKLSEVLRGIRRLSPQTAAKIAVHLNLADDERALFLNLVGAHQKRSTTARAQAEENLKALAHGAEYGELGLERFKIISDWYHLAILEMTELENFESEPSWIAGRLGISTPIAREAIERLLSFGLLEWVDGRLKQTHLNLATPTGIPSREIREHHSQILMKAEAALQETEISERDFSAITVAFDPEQMPEVREELKNLRRRLSEKIQDRTTAKSRVYSLAIQFFPLDRLKSKKASKGVRK